MTDRIFGLSEMKYPLFSYVACILWLHTPELYADTGRLAQYLCVLGTVPRLDSKQTTSATVSNEAVSIDYRWGVDTFNSSISFNSSASSSELEMAKLQILSNIQQVSTIEFYSLTRQRRLAFKGLGDFSESSILALEGGATVTPGSDKNNALLTLPAYSAGGGG